MLRKKVLVFDYVFNLSLNAWNSFTKYGDVKDKLWNFFLLTLYDKFKILVFKWLQKKVNGGKNEEANRHCPLTQKSAKTLFTDVAVHVWKDG